MPQNDNDYKNFIYTQFSRIGKAISSPKRVELLNLLCQGSRSVEQLANESGMTIANVSQHLQVLRSARFLEARKDGLQVYYRIADASVDNFLHNLQMLAKERLTELDYVARSYLKDHKLFEPIDQKVLAKRISQGDVVVLDVRPMEEYAAAHICGAVSIPLRELKARLSELPRNQEIVAYCRGIYCIMATRAVKLLRACGYQANHIETGLYEWKREGFPVEGMTY